MAKKYICTYTVVICDYIMLHLEILSFHLNCYFTIPYLQIVKFHSTYRRPFYQLRTIVPFLLAGTVYYFCINCFSTLNFYNREVTLELITKA